MAPLEEIGKNTAIRLMNEYERKKNPFLFIIDFLQEHVMVIDPARIPQDQLMFSVGQHSNIPDQVEDFKPAEFRKFPISFDEYRNCFNHVQKHIAHGNTYLINLTCSTPILTNLSLREIFIRSRSKYRLWLKDRFVVFSPETFITISKGIIRSNPMKGTIDAGIPGAMQILLDDQKEIAEHYTIVDLIRNDLSMVARQVRVARFRYIEEIKTHQGALLQASSEISGIIPAHGRNGIGDILFRLLPAGSISGAPKEKTLEIIRETETHERGYYTGVFGYFDGQDLESAVMIRFIEQKDGAFVFKSGGGITSFSDVKKEYMEMVDKVYLPFSWSEIIPDTQRRSSYPGFHKQ